VGATRLHYAANKNLKAMGFAITVLEGSPELMTPGCQSAPGVFCFVRGWFWKIMGWVVVGLVAEGAQHCCALQRADLLARRIFSAVISWGSGLRAAWIFLGEHFTGANVYGVDLSR
jgi:hypothetical protein